MARGEEKLAGKLMPGDSVIVEIERIVPGGMGLAHALGHTIFVALAAPGDRVRASIERRQGKVLFASIVEVLSPSPERIEPPCPYFGRCGGCDFQQLNYEAQLKAKTEIIRDSLRRIARVEPPEEIRIEPAPAAWRYRSRAQWQYDPEKNQLGYFERGSHRVCDVVECPVVLPQLQQTLERLREHMQKGTLPKNAIDFQAVAGDDDVSLAPPVDPFTTREIVRTLGGERYRFNAESFFQINHDLLERLIREAIKEADDMEERARESAVDLYCGAGLFTLPLARRFARVTGVEANSRSSEWARRNLAEAHLTNAKIETARVGSWLTKHAQALAPASFLVLDPPRAGAEIEAIRGILLLRPRRIAYVSCDPPTLARDLRLLIDGGYRLDSIVAFDMFPQTHHVETIAHLLK